jgi:hypothetical protein
VPSTGASERRGSGGARADQAAAAPPPPAAPAGSARTRQRLRPSTKPPARPVTRDRPHLLPPSRLPPRAGPATRAACSGAGREAVAPAPAAPCGMICRGMGRARQSSARARALWALVLLLAAPASSLQPLERSTAFIGYAEDAPRGGAAATGALRNGGGPDAPLPGLLLCRDRRETCEVDASSDQCLVNPYSMRRMCPISCAVEGCVHTGSAREVRARTRRPLGRPRVRRCRSPLARPSPPLTCSPPAARARPTAPPRPAPPRPPQSFRHAGAASADGTWAYADAFKQRRGDGRGVSANHYNSVFYFQGAAGARGLRAARARALHAPPQGAPGLLHARAWRMRRRMRRPPPPHAPPRPPPPRRRRHAGAELAGGGHIPRRTRRRDRRGAAVGGAVQRHARLERDRHGCDRGAEEKGTAGRSGLGAQPGGALRRQCGASLQRSLAGLRLSCSRPPPPRPPPHCVPSQPATTAPAAAR